MGTSHRVTTVFAIREASEASEGNALAIFALSCGCVVRRDVQRDRVIEFGNDEFTLGGKYTCPLDHPVRHRDVPRCAECGPISPSTCVICGGAWTTCEHLACVLCGGPLREDPEELIAP